MTAKRRRGSPHRGDVFEIAAPDGRLGYGVVIEGGGCPYIAVLHGLHDNRPEMSQLENNEIALIGWTMDSWFFHARWIVIGMVNPARFDVPYPTYLVEVDGELRASDYKGKILGPVHPDEVGLLDCKSSHSPMGFQDAFLALHGYREWDSANDKLTIDYARKRMTERLRTSRVISRTVRSGLEADITSRQNGRIVRITGPPSPPGTG